MVRIFNIKIKNQNKPIFCKKLILTFKGHRRRRRRLEGHPLQVRHKKNWVVSLSKTVRSRASCGARCMGDAIRMWSAVCSEAPHLQFGEGARPRLCMDE